MSKARVESESDMNRMGFESAARRCQRCKSPLTVQPKGLSACSRSSEFINPTPVSARVAFVRVAEQVSSVVSLKPALGIDCGHATGSRSGDGLAVRVILHVAAAEDPINVGQ